MMQLLTRRQVLAGAAALVLAPRAVRAAGIERLVVAGGALTEIVAALSEGKRLVGVDTTSIHPAAAVKGLPTIGYLRQLSAEGILSLNPSLLLASEQAGPPAVLEQLRAAKVNVAMVPETYAVANVPGKIRVVATALGRAAEGEAMAAAVDADLAATARALQAATRKPRVLFLLSIADGRLLAGGSHTAADTMIALGGGRNAVQSYAGYKPLSAEAALAADPDTVLLTTQSLEALGGLKGLQALPQLANLSAIREGRVVARDALYLLGLGPRSAQAAHDLAQAIHRGLDLPALPARPWA